MTAILPGSVGSASDPDGSDEGTEPTNSSVPSSRYPQNCWFPTDLDRGLSKSPEEFERDVRSSFVKKGNRERPPDVGAYDSLPPFFGMKDLISWNDG